MTSTMQAVSSDSWMCFFFFFSIFSQDNKNSHGKIGDCVALEVLTSSMQAPSISTLAQYVPVQFRYSIRVDGPWQEVSKPLMAPRSCSVSGCPIFVESNKVKRAFFSMPIDVGRVGVVPVFFKLFSKNTFCWQLILQGQRNVEKFVKFRNLNYATCCPSH